MGGRAQLLDPTLLVAVKRRSVMHAGLLRLCAAASLGDGLQGAGALWAEGGGGGQVLRDAGAGGEGGVGRVALAVEVIDAVGGPATQSSSHELKANQSRKFPPFMFQKASEDSSRTRTRTLTAGPPRPHAEKGTRSYVHTSAFNQTATTGFTMVTTTTTGLLGPPGGAELLAGGVGRVGSPLTVGVVLGPRVVLGREGMVQTLHAAPGAVLIRTLPQVRPRVKAAGQVAG